MSYHEEKPAIETPTYLEETAISRLDHPHPLGHGDDESEVEPDIGWRTVLTIFSSMVGYYAAVYCLIVPANIASAAIAQIGGADTIPFIQTGQIVILSCLGPMVGMASDQFGRKWVYVAMLLIGLIGSIICATAKSGPVLLLGVLLAGCTITSQVISLSIPSEVLPHRMRPLGQAFTQMVSAVGGVTGFFVTAHFLSSGDPDGWRKPWWILTGLIALSLITLVVGYNPIQSARNREPTLIGKLKALDPVGSFLFCGFLVPLVVALNFGGAAYPWVSAQVLVPMLLGFVSLAAFGVWEWKGTSTGLLHHELFTVHGTRNFIIALWIQSVEGFVFIAFISFYPFESSVLWESDPILGALRGSILFICYGVFALPLGWYSKRTRNVKDTLVVGFVIFLGGIIGLATTTPDSGKAAIAYAVLVGIGTSVPVIQLVVLVQLATPPWLIGTATAIDISIRGVGAIIGATIVGAILNNKLAVAIPERIIAAALALGASPTSLPAIIGSTAWGNATALATAAASAGIPADEIPAFIGACFGALKDAYAWGFHWIWITEIPVIVVGLISIFLLKPIKKELNWVIDAPQEKQAVADQERAVAGSL